MVRLERTDQQTLPEAAATEEPAGKALVAALGEEDLGKRQNALRALLEKYPGGAASLRAALELIELAGRVDTPDPKTVTAAVEQALAIAAPYGREMKLQTHREAAERLGQSTKLADLALAQAEKAHALLDAADSLAVRARTLHALVAASRRAKKPVDARLETALDEAERRLDEEFRREAILTREYPGRKSKSQRVVLVELFTSSQSPVCVAAQVAFGALQTTYNPKDVVFIQYHLHVPGADPLAGPAGQKRADAYAVVSAPRLFLDGRPPRSEGRPLAVGGPLQRAAEYYSKLVPLLEAELEEPAQASLKLEAKRNRDEVTIDYDYAGLQKTGEKVRLRVALVEERVAYAGQSGLRMHYHVVRAFLSPEGKEAEGAEGIALDKKAGKGTVKVSLGKLRKDFAKAAKDKGLTEDELPLKLDNLKAISFIQDGAQRAVLQAAQCEVPR
jgi:hypothetical protein